MLFTQGQWDRDYGRGKKRGLAENGIEIGKTSSNNVKEMQIT